MTKDTTNLMKGLGGDGFISWLGLLAGTTFGDIAAFFTMLLAIFRFYYFIKNKNKNKGEENERD